MSFGQNRDAEGTLSNLPALVSRARRAILCLGLLLPALFTWGCSGIVSGQNTTASQPPPQTFSISGTITPVTGGNGATITVTGAANATATANSSGNFTVSGLANGTYTITPSHAGYSFSPSSMNVTISNASVTTGISFTATALTFGISGTLNPAIGGSGATVTLSGPASSTTTSDGAGNYSFSGLANGMYAVTPSHAGYTFNPGTQTATINGANVTGVNFTAQANQTFTISGTLSPTTGGSGATVALTGAAVATTTADGAGNYTFIGLGNGAYTGAPTSTGYAVTPTRLSVAISGANVLGLNFTANAVAAHTVALSWTSSTSSTATGYNVYRSTVTGTGYVKITPLPLSAALFSFTDTNLLSGTTYFYVTTAVDATGVGSSFSNEAIAAIP